MGEGRTQTNSEEVDTRPCGGGVGGATGNCIHGPAVTSGGERHE